MSEAAHRPHAGDHPRSLSDEQAATLATPRKRYGILARILFAVMNLLYGRRRSLSKTKVLELIARVPYQSWEQVAYVAVTHTYGDPSFARRIFEFVRESREQQDNEQWHLLILEELVQRRGIRENVFRYRVLPQLIALFYYHISWLLYVVRPRLSYGLNADFEDHAEHEYMELVREHPELESEPFVSAFEADYGRFASVADALRQMGVDERHHKEHSELRMQHARFG